jgi:putative transposase
VSLAGPRIQTNIYQLKALHKEFGHPLNVVVIIKTQLILDSPRMVLFSFDLALAADRLIDYYSLRFQIEFNFRDAKQFWGLEDFMNLGQTPIHPWLAKDCQSLAFHGEPVQGAHQSIQTS